MKSEKDEMKKRAPTQTESCSSLRPKQQQPTKQQHSINRKRCPSDTVKRDWDRTRAHCIHSGTRPAQVYLDMFCLHDANVSPNGKGANAHAPWPSGQVRAVRAES